MSGKFNLKTGRSTPNQVIQGLFDSDDDENQKPQDKEDLLPKFVPSATQRGPSKAQIMKNESVSGSQEGWRYFNRHKEKEIGPDHKFAGRVVGKFNVNVNLNF